MLFLFLSRKLYESRYVKLAHSMRDIDLIAEKMVANFKHIPAFEGIEPVIREYQRRQVEDGKPAD